jgi:glycosyltransferase involved in cell wall biosynthesis
MNILKIGSSDGEPLADPQTLRRRFDDAMAFLESEDFDAAAKSMLGFSESVVACARKNVVGVPLERPTVSVVVVSYRNNSNLRRCLEELSRQTENLQAEIILVNNGNDEFFLVAEEIIRNYTAITMPFPSGVSSGRNVGARFSAGSSIVFIDDDGVPEPRCIENLVACLDETDAIGVRGRVRPLTSPVLTAAHYDLGERRVPCLIDTEGISIWRKGIFEAAGGFDPLLYGHEGIELCGRLWRFYGPGAFLYEPNAVLLHDFGGDSIEADRKSLRHVRLRRYIDGVRPEVHQIIAATKRASMDGRMLQLYY